MKREKPEQRHILCGQGQRAGTSTEASPARKIRSATATSITEGQTAMRCVACGTEFQRVDFVDLSPGNSGHEQRILVCLLLSRRACAIQGRKLQKTHKRLAWKMKSCALTAFKTSRGKLAHMSKAPGLITFRKESFSEDAACASLRRWCPIPLPTRTQLHGIRGQLRRIAVWTLP